MDKTEQDTEKINLILEFDAFFRKHEIAYLLALGTACKFYETRQILKPDKDHDTDFFVWSDQIDKLKESLHDLENSGWQVESNEGYKVQVIKKNKEKELMVEIIFLYKEEGKVCFSTSDPANGRSCYSADLFERGLCNLGDQEVYIVGQNFCKQHYGY